jgi:hypothetical protein
MIINCCLTASDSAATARTPLGTGEPRENDQQMGDQNKQQPHRQPSFSPFRLFRKSAQELDFSVRITDSPHTGSLLQMFCRQPQIERGSVNSPCTAYLEPWKCAAIDHAIDCRGMHAQYFGNLADGENILEFRPLRPNPVHQLTSAIQISPESRVTS